MRILFVAHRTPFPPDKGEKIRAYHILAQLAKLHTVSLIYWVDDQNDVVHASTLEGLCKGEVAPQIIDATKAKLRALRALLSGKSFSEGYYYSTQFQETFDCLVSSQRPDLIYVFSSAMAGYAKKYAHVPTVVDFVDVDSDKWGQLSHYSHFPLKQLFRLEESRLRKLEIEISRWFGHSLFVSEVEVELFRHLGGEGKIVSLPNGVSVESGAITESSDATFRGNRQMVISFVGTMNYFPNSDAVLYFARDVLPRIRQQCPQTIFEVVGRNPPKAILRLNGKGGIRIVGGVDSVDPYLRRADVSVAPMRMARGVQNKVLEAMAYGVPVVATSEAVKGLKFHPDREVLIGDSAETFTQQVIRVLSDIRLRKELADRARQTLRELYDWTIIGAQLENMIVKVVPHNSEVLV